MQSGLIITGSAVSFREDIGNTRARRAHGASGSRDQVVAGVRSENLASARDRRDFAAEIFRAELKCAHFPLHPPARENDGQMAIGGTRANQGVGWLLLVTEVNIELCCSGATLGAMKTIIAVLLFSSLAMGQNLRDQQACYRQSKKVADKAVTFANHFDGKTCWVEEFNNTSSSPVVYERWVFNAFESYSTESYFQGELGKSPNVCFVGSQPCRSINEFDILVTKKYGLK